MDEFSPQQWPLMDNEGAVTVKCKRWWHFECKEGRQAPDFSPRPARWL